MPKPAKKKKRDNLLIRLIKGGGNFLNEERAASQEDYAELRRLRKNPKYRVNK
jgi:hypothetical protein